MNDRHQDNDSQGSQCHLTSEKKPEFQFIDETGNELHTINDCDFAFSARTEPVDLSAHMQHIHENNGLAAPIQLPKERQIRLVQQLQRAPSKDADYTVRRAKFQAGQLRLLLSVPLQEGKHQFWWNPDTEKNCAEIAEKVLGRNSKIRCVGSPLKFSSNRCIWNVESLARYKS